MTIGTINPIIITIETEIRNATTVEKGDISPKIVGVGIPIDKDEETIIIIIIITTPTTPTTIIIIPIAIINEMITTIVKIEEDKTSLIKIKLDI